MKLYTTRSVASIDSFEVIFNHFLTHIGDEPWFSSDQALKVYPHKHVLRVAPPKKKKKSNGAKSHDLGGQFISARREITRPGRAIELYSVELCGMWHPLVETTYFPNRILQ